MTDLTTPPTRFVLLGASNGVMGLPRVLAHVRAMTGGPVELWAAVGHGRSYGAETSVLGRRLCGIRESSLFDKLSAASPAPTYGLLTDLGNDLLYGQSVDVTLRWALECADRLLKLGVKLSVTRMPVDNLDTLSESRFRLFRAALFPRHRVSLEVISSRARDLNEKFFEKMSERDAPCLALNSDWYGFDPIHFKRSRASEAWRALLARCLEVDAHARGAAPSIRERISMSLAKPEKRRVLFVSQQTAQPCLALRDGSVASLY